MSSAGSSSNDNNGNRNGKEWLDLGLGQGGSKTERITGPGSSQSTRANREGELGLGLGLGVGDDGVRKRGGSSGMDMESPLASQGSSSASFPLPLQPSSSSGHVSHQDRENPPSYAPLYGQGAGIWFTLRPRNGGGGEVLPEMPKYIRVKDESVKVSNVKAYLVKKLGLTSAAEVEVTCMGEKLLPSQTLKEVRDTVWFPRLMGSLNVAATPSVVLEFNRDDYLDYLLTLDYQTRSSSDLEE